jgi:hypothetical protein
VNPAFCRLSPIAGPTPGNSRTDFVARKPCASAAPITEKPRGLSRSEAILARTLLGARPMETVMPTSASISAWTLASARAGQPLLIRSVPDRSSQASSSDRGWTRGVSRSSLAMIRRLSRMYLVKSGLSTTASGQAFSAVNIGMAERTP